MVHCFHSVVAVILCRRILIPRHRHIITHILFDGHVLHDLVRPVNAFAQALHLVKDRVLLVRHHGIESLVAHDSIGKLTVSCFVCRNIVSDLLQRLIRFRFRYRCIFSRHRMANVIVVTLKSFRQRNHVAVVVIGNRIGRFQLTCRIEEIIDVLRHALSFLTATAIVVNAFYENTCVTRVLCKSGNSSCVQFAGTESTFLLHQKPSFCKQLSLLIIVVYPSL